MCFFKKPEPFLPHPEEPKNEKATLDNVNLEAVIDKWLKDWQVPEAQYLFWLDVKYRLSLTYPYPSATSAETKEIWIRPEWCNPGVIAHECCHIAWQYLNDVDRAQFQMAFNQNKNAPLVERVLKKMSDKDPNWKNSLIEIHADIYRYLGQSMPNALRTFYPFLLED